MSTTKKQLFFNDYIYIYILQRISHAKKQKKCPNLKDSDITFNRLFCQNLAVLCEVLDCANHL